MLRKAFFIISIISLALMSFSPSAVPIFSDGFESGNLSAWSGKLTDLGDLMVTSAAALEGTKGMRARVDDNNSIYVQDDSPKNENHYNASFRFDPHSVPMANMDTLTIFTGLDSTSSGFVPALRIEVRYAAGSYQIAAGARNDDLTWISTIFFNISDAPHEIEVEWDAATAPGSNDGRLRLKIDGLLKGNRTGIFNEKFRIDRARLGAVAYIDNGTRGIYYFDSFESYRD